MFKSIILVALAFAACQAAPVEEKSIPFKPLVAFAEMHGMIVNKTTGLESLLRGVVEFIQDAEQGPLRVMVNITFSPSFDGQDKVLRGMHVHAKPVSNHTGDPAIDCATTGPHWNPRNVTHGLLESNIHHNGDLGNLITKNGQISTEKESKFLTLVGSETIINRSVVLHERIDDGGLGTDPTSKLAGNSGLRIACGSIKLRKD